MDNGVFRWGLAFHKVFFAVHSIADVHVLHTGWSKNLDFTNFIYIVLQHNIYFVLKKHEVPEWPPVFVCICAMGMPFETCFPDYVCIHSAYNVKHNSPLYVLADMITLVVLPSYFHLSTFSLCSINSRQTYWILRIIWQKIPWNFHLLFGYFWQKATEWWFFGNILWSNVLNISCNFVRDLFVVGNGTVCSRGKK